jgi:hypothetical protein
LTTVETELVSANWNRAGDTLWHEELEYSLFVEKTKLVEVPAVALLETQRIAGRVGWQNARNDKVNTVN